MRMEHSFMGLVSLEARLLIRAQQAVRTQQKDSYLSTRKKALTRS